MSNNKQTAVEWLYNKMYEHHGLITIEEFEQAKAMHKEEMIDALLFGDVLSLNTAETYYKVKFGGNNEQQ
jgi:hypothetical protein